MNANSIILQNVSAEQLTDILTNVFRNQLLEFKKELATQEASDELMTRAEVLDLLKVNASTLYHWTQAGKIKVYKFGGKAFYKRSQITFNK